MDTSQQRAVCEEITNAEVAKLVKDDLTVEQKIEHVLHFTAYGLKDVTEADLRLLFVLAEIDLTDPYQYGLCKEYTTWYVAQDAIDLSDLLEPSLVDPTTSLYRQAIGNDHMMERTDNVKSESIFFREVVVPGL